MLKKLFLVYFVVFIGFVGYSLMITIFTPLFLRLDIPILPTSSPLSTRTIWLGIILFLYPFAQFLSSPILGALSDKFGRKKLLLFSIFCSIIFYSGVAIAIDRASLALLILSLFLAGLSEGNVTICQSAIADVTTTDERRTFFGYIYLSISLSYILGPLMGGKLAHWFSYPVPFWAIAFLQLLNFIWIAYFFKETSSTFEKQKIQYFEAFSNMKHIFTSKRFRYLFGINFIIYLAVFGFFRSYPMFIVDEFNATVNTLAELIAWVSVPIIIVNGWLLGFLSKIISPLKLLLIALFFTALFIESLLISDTMEVLWVTLFFTAFGIAFCLPTSAALLSGKASSEEQGRVMGNNQSLQYLAESLSGIAAGFLAAVSIKLPMAAFGLCSLVAGFLLLPLFRSSQ